MISISDQEFLASYGVQIDESGVSRLQSVLSSNRDLAEKLSSAFSGADAAVEGLLKRLESPVSGALLGLSGSLSRLSGLSVGGPTGEVSLSALRPEVPDLRTERDTDLRPLADRLRQALADPLEKIRDLYESIDFGSAGAAGQNWEEELSRIDAKWTDLLDRMSQPVRLRVDTAAAESGARVALDAVRRVFAEPVYADIRFPAASGLNAGSSAFLRMSSGGRFSRPTEVQVAEDGDAEYIIPVRKENRALPLLRQLLGELSPAARQSLSADAGFSPAVREEHAAGGLSGGFSGGLSAVTPSVGDIVQNTHTVSAPVTIHVTASGADGREIGESIYDTAEKYLVRALKEATA